MTESNNPELSADAQRLLRDVAREIRLSPLMEDETVQRLLANKATRHIAEAAVEFCVDERSPLNPKWPKSGTWAQVVGKWNTLKRRTE